MSKNVMIGCLIFLTVFYIVDAQWMRGQVAESVLITTRAVQVARTALSASRDWEEAYNLIKIRCDGK